MNLSFIIPNYNGAKFLPDCLKSLPQDQEIIVVDNGSTDNSLSLVKNHKVIKNPTNLGFAKAVNQGILAATNDYVALINNDLVLHPNWFKHITQAINQHPHAVAFGGLILTRDGKYIESEGLKYFWHGQCLNLSNGQAINESYFINHKSSSQVWGLNAAATVYHRQTLINVGLFDEDFFAYEEDVDLSLRLNKLGYQSIYMPQAISYHLGGGTSSGMGNFRHRMDTKNWIYIIIKNYSRVDIIKNFFPIIIERLRNLSGLIKNTPFPQIPSSLVSTYGQVVKNLPKMLTKRRQLLKLIQSSQSYDHRR